MKTKLAITAVVVLLVTTGSVFGETYFLRGWRNVDGASNGSDPFVEGVGVEVVEGGVGLNVPNKWTRVDTNETLWVRSTNGSDTGVLNVEGLDRNGLWQKKSVTLTGNSPVQVGGVWRRVNVFERVSGTSNLGQVYLNSTSKQSVAAGDTSLLRGVILSGKGRWNTSSFSIPKGKKNSYIRSWTITATTINPDVGATDSTSTGIAIIKTRNLDGPWSVLDMIAFTSNSAELMKRYDLGGGQGRKVDEFSDVVVGVAVTGSASFLNSEIVVEVK